MIPRLPKGYRFRWERAMRGAGLRPMLRLYLHALASYMDADGNDCMVSAKALAEDLGIKRPTVFELQREAVEAGWLRVVSKGGISSGNGGSGKTNRFLPLIPGEEQQSGDDLTVGECSPETNSQVATGTNSQVATRLNQPGTNGGKQIDPIVALLDGQWSKVSTPEERQEPARLALIREASQQWSTATTEAVLRGLADGAYSIRRLDWWLRNRLGGTSEAEALEKLRALKKPRSGSRTVGGMTSNVAGTEADHGETRKVWGREEESTA